MTTEKMHNLVENYVLLLDGHTDDWNLGDHLLVSSEGLFQRDKERTRIYRRFCTHTHTQTNQVLLIKEKQTSQVNEYSPFLYLVRCKSLGSLKSFCKYLGPISCFLHLESPQGAPSMGVGEGWLQWLMTWWPQHPLFTDMAGDILYLLWHEFE